MTLDHRYLFLLDQSAFEKAFDAVDAGEPDEMAAAIVKIIPMEHVIDG